MPPGTIPIGTPGRLPPREGLHEGHVVGFGERLVEVPDRVLVDEDLHVPTQPILLVDHAEADAGVPTVEVVQQFGDRGTLGVYHGLLAGVGPQRGGDPDLHGQRSAGSATSTE